MARGDSFIGERSLPRWIRGLALILVIVGTVFVVIISGPVQRLEGSALITFIAKDMAFVFLSLVAMYIGRRVTRTFLIRILPWIGIVGFILTAAVLLPGIGTQINGGRRWLVVGLFQFQPSELMKLIVCVGLPLVLVERRHYIFGRIHPVLAWAIALGGAGMVLLEPDMGTGAVIVFISLAIVWVWGINTYFLKWFAALGITGVVASFAIFPYQLQRLIDVYIPRLCDPQNNCYQLNQSKIGLGSGGIIGPGPGHIRSAWGFLPNANTDFIFSVIGEAFGYVGSVGIILIYLAFLYCGMQASLNARDEAAKYVAIGITTWFGVEAAINIASCIGLFAVTGIPLPLVSYGGTALVVNMMAVGILINIAENRGFSQLPMRETISLLRRA